LTGYLPFLAIRLMISIILFMLLCMFIYEANKCSLSQNRTAPIIREVNYMSLFHSICILMTEIQRNGNGDELALDIR